MSTANLHKEMLTRVAQALGPELLPQMAFVGGCTTALMVTDDFTRERIRHTDDVDLIVNLLGYAPYASLLEKLRERGFSQSADNEDPICAMRLAELRVDFMPDDAGILGFTNIWYKDALKTADDYQLTKELNIKLVKPVYFIGTKLEAYLGRGNNDPMGSRDIEDLLVVYDGRPALLDEIQQATKELRGYIAQQLTQLLDNNNFEYAVQSAALNDKERENLIFERLEQTSQMK